MTLEEELTEAMKEGYRSAGLAIGYWANYYLRDVRRKGGLATAKHMMRPATNTAIQDGFQKLIDAGRIDLATEQLVISDRFASLFTSQEIAEAQRRLDLVPDHVQQRDVPPEFVHPETLAETRTYHEGSVRRVLVSVYERDSAARDACLERHGFRCKACGMDFEKRYGEIGCEFIHVHHKKPLASCRSDYELDPVKDLVPVCPNCHAMLHTKDPPLSVAELKGHLQRATEQRKRPRK